VPFSKLVSGGQTGVDRGALDAALAAGFPCGGWCPRGRVAEDGTIPARYPVVELARGSYVERTIQNIVDSDATLVIYFARLHGGTEQTVLQCISKRKPYQLIDATAITVQRAAEVADGFVSAHDVFVLNVAGPRASHSPSAYAYSFDVVTQLLRLQRNHR
jgi:hypothetical protein